MQRVLPVLICLYLYVRKRCSGGFKKQKKPPEYVPEVCKIMWGYRSYFPVSAACMLSGCIEAFEPSTGIGLLLEPCIRVSLRCS